MGVASWISHKEMDHVLAALMPQNRLAVEVSIRTGLRIGDVLRLRPADLRTARPTIREQKTGKTRRLYLPRDLLERLRQNAGEFWVFPGRLDPHKHRQRQAVYKDVRRAAAVFQRTGAVRRGAQVSTHSARKIAAVDARKRGGMAAAQRLLNHSDPAITRIYALADLLAEKGGETYE